jgi:hypothetical protein
MQAGNGTVAEFAKNSDRAGEYLNSGESSYELEAASS